MEFRVTRTSGYHRGDGDPPCKGAVWRPEVIDPNGDSTVHRGHWWVWIESIEELVSLAQDIGPVIVMESFRWSRDQAVFMELEIYDDYRE